MNSTRIRGIQRVLIAAAAVAVALGVTSSSARLAARGAQQNENGIQPEAMAQIEALLREKETRTPAERKIDSQLLYARRMELGVPIAPGVQTLEVDIPRADDGHVIVDVKANVTGQPDAAVERALPRDQADRRDRSPPARGPRSDRGDRRAAGCPLRAAAAARLYVADGVPRPVRGSSANRAARRAAALESVLRAHASQQDKSAGARVTAAGRWTSRRRRTLIGTGAGAVSSQADITHRTAVFRGLTGFNGSGREDRRAVRRRRAPRRGAGVGRSRRRHRAPGQAGSGDEGTAMLELIHDIAPGAQLYFATAFTSITSFAQNIRDLRTAGCDIIVDDVGYFVETPFQDGQGPAVVSPTNGGVVTQAVKDVTAAGALYFSSAGNSGNLNDGTSGVWEGDFNLGAATVDPPIPAASAGNFHRFTGVPGLQHADAGRVRPDQSLLVGSARRLGQRLRHLPAEHAPGPPSPRARRISRTARRIRTSR